MNKIGFKTNSNNDTVGMFNCEVLPTSLIVIRYEDNISECSEVVDMPTELDDAEVEHVTFGGAINSSKVICVAFKGMPSMCDMVHESSHAATAFCYVHDIPFRPNDDEMHAYLTEWIFKCINNFFCAKKK